MAKLKPAKTDIEKRVEALMAPASESAFWSYAQVKALLIRALTEGTTPIARPADKPNS